MKSRSFGSSNSRGGVKSTAYEILSSLDGVNENPLRMKSIILS